MSTKELYNSISTTLQERIKSPILGTFILTWVWINWEPISIFLFSDFSIEVRIKYIANVYRSTWNAVWFPLIVASAYAILLPFIHWGTEYLSAKAHTGREKVKASKRIGYLDEQILVKRKEIELEQDEKEHKDLLANKNIVKDLENQIEALQKALDSSLETNKASLETLNRQLEENMIALRVQKLEAEKTESDLRTDIINKDLTIKDLRNPPRKRTRLITFEDGNIIREITTLRGGTNMISYETPQGSTLEKSMVENMLKGNAWKISDIDEA